MTPIEESARRRLERMIALKGNEAAQAVEMEMCRRDPLHFFANWVWTFDPRAAAEGKPAHLPFDLFPRQVEMVGFIMARLQAREDGLIEKSRDIGFTWVAGGLAVWAWIFRDGFKTTFGSRKEDLVDKRGEPDSIFEKMRYVIRGLPGWMVPNGFDWKQHDNHMRLVNPANGNTVAGEAGRDIGRGGRSSLIFIDEAAFLEDGDSVDASTSGNTDVRIWGSTVNGMGNIFAKKRHNGSLRPDQIFRFHYAQPLDAKILTPTGWKRMGEMEVGDFVFGPDGKPRKVLGVYPQGEKPVFRVGFNDGSSTECCEDHLWSVIPYGNQRAERRHILKTMQLRDIRRDYVKKDARGYNRHAYQIPITAPVEFSARSLPLDPYVLGCLLGDGSFPKNRVRPIVLTTTDLEMVDLIAARLPAGCRLLHAGGIQYRISVDSTGRGGAGRGQRNPVVAAIRGLRLSGAYSHTKFIPEEYLLASVESRLELLQGLMDTDGSVRRTDPGSGGYTTVSPRLAEDVVFLVQSLGGTAKVHIDPPETRQIMSNVRESHCRETYTVIVRLPQGMNPFKIVRKAEAFKPASRYAVRRSLTRIEEVGAKPCQCIKVDAPDGLYLTDECIVTHNTDDPRKTPEWAERKRKGMEPHKWASEYDIDYSASVEGVCIPAKWVMAAVELAKIYPVEPPRRGIAGGDVGAGGSGKSVFIARFGPVTLPPISWGNPDTIETAHRMVEEATKIALPRKDGWESRVTVLAYDAPGVGIGVQSALRHHRRVGLVTTAVNTGDTPSEVEWPDGETSEQKFLNLRAELWWTMRARFKASYELYCLLQGEPEGQPHPISDCILLPSAESGPDAHQLISQLSLPKWYRNEKGKIQIESKKKMAERGIPSPDHADALALTHLPDPDPLEIYRKIAARC